MTLRPASATWSSAVTPGRLADDESGVGDRPASSTGSRMTSEVDGTTRVLRRPGRDWRGTVDPPSSRPDRPRARSRACCPVSGASPGSPAKTSARLARPSSAPLTSSASSSTKRSTTRPSRDDVDLVEAQLDARVGGLDDALPAQLPDRHELDERRVTGQLEDERTGIGCRPVDRALRAVGRRLRAPRDASPRRHPRSGRAT